MTPKPSHAHPHTLPPISHYRIKIDITYIYPSSTFSLPSFAPVRKPRTLNRSQNILILLQMPEHQATLRHGDQIEYEGWSPASSRAALSTAGREGGEGTEPSFLLLPENQKARNEKAFWGRQGLLKRRVSHAAHPRKAVSPVVALPATRSSWCVAQSGLFSTEDC